MGVMLEVTPELRSDSLIDLELNPKVVDLIGYDDYQVHPDAAISPIQGNILRNSMMQGRYPVITGTLDAAGNLVTNSIGFLYDALLDNATIYKNDGSPGAAKGTTDINDSLYNSPRYYEQFREFDHDDLPQAPALWGRMPYYRLREIETQVTVADGSTVGMGGLIYDKLETYRDKVPVLGSIPFLGRLFRSEGEKSVKRNLMIFVTATQVDANGRKASDLALKK
ncbi:hypothetical protein GT409_15230 [Tichowtungia aerotolerans]|uniref:Type II/III secretion system secretin-like domain-containing protein n=2 Tax=Tichowtungia aerotolerans TaxID=2697043 RepID=A0A6P1M8B4_9BACT|nr:hypothetical protein GT409_15230 [Tichowtungia aerotolerans]